MNMPIFWKVLQKYFDNVYALLAFAGLIWTLVSGVHNFRSEKKRRILFNGCILVVCGIFLIGRWVQINADKYTEVPDVIGKVRDDACSALSNCGLKYTIVIEVGDFISEQSPQAGEFVPVGTEVRLSLKAASGGTGPDTVDEKQQLLNEVNNLTDQLHEISQSEEYILIDGVGKDLIVADVLDFHALIDLLRNLSRHYSSTSLVRYMREAGYDVDNKEDSSVMDEFLDLGYSQQAEILSYMFGSAGVYEYVAALEYEYTADVKEEEGIKKNYNVRANVMQTATKGIRLFIVRGLSDDPFGLTERMD